MPRHVLNLVRQLVRLADQVLYRTVLKNGLVSERRAIEKRDHLPRQRIRSVVIAPIAVGNCA
jgi:hypothetical protein